ncbi:FYVE, RhoGEF and PH domain-containing protein 4 [Liparis tanakae]|uniref:FYVE, RhoGEF and PH domain-containing protein 4 n=1 Tax=Liparis tanakae TaxID=230148 RepID=A0A4Z2J4E8_9TELE|nr:FYVE, RhoGEF and PH domain-containing protein 4 [Liparis tanakae]
MVTFTDSRRDGSGSPLRQPGKTAAGSPAHRARQRQTETAGAQENPSSGPASPQDARQPPTNGALAQMERDEEEVGEVEEVAPEERTDGGARLEADGLVNGDTERSAERSPPPTHGTETQEDTGTRTQSEHGAEDGSPEQKTPAPSPETPGVLLCVWRSTGCRPVTEALPCQTLRFSELKCRQYTEELRPVAGSKQEVGGDETNEQKLFKIASELLHTEKAYVARLNLLDQVRFTLFF